MGSAVMYSHKQWYALYVKSRHEFMTQNELSRKGIDSYLPSVKKQRQWKDRRKSIEFPLFPGYCFVRITPQPEEFLNVLKTRGAVTLISNRPGCPSPVPNEEIDALRLLIESGRKLDLYPHLATGMRVQIKQGLLKGATGTLVSKEDGDLFLVNVQLLGRSVGVRIYADDIEAA